jgi:hypothetical protein
MTCRGSYKRPYHVRRREVLDRTYKTVEGVLHADGKVTLPAAELPSHSVRVMVTFLEPGEELALSEPGDYLTTLTDYEERLARGEVRWQ